MPKWVLLMLYNVIYIYIYIYIHIIYNYMSISNIVYLLLRKLLVSWFQILFIFCYIMRDQNKPSPNQTGQYIDIYTCQPEKREDLISIFIHSQTCRYLVYRDQFIACDNRIQSPALFQSIFKFCAFWLKFHIFCPFSEKSYACPYFLE